MSKFKNLEQMGASDFGVDPSKFDAMVQAGRTGDRRFAWFLGVVVGINVVLFLSFQVVAFPGLIFLWLVHWGFHARANRMAKELGITSSRVRQVLRARRTDARTLQA